MPHLLVVVVLHSLYDKLSCLEKGRLGRPFLLGSMRSFDKGILSPRLTGYIYLANVFRPVVTRVGSRRRRGLRLPEPVMMSLWFDGGVGLR